MMEQYKWINRPEETLLKKRKKLKIEMMRILLLMCKSNKIWEITPEAIKFKCKVIIKISHLVMLFLINKILIWLRIHCNFNRKLIICLISQIIKLSIRIMIIKSLKKDMEIRMCKSQLFKNRIRFKTIWK